MKNNIEKYFEEYVSNTLAGVGNQSYFNSDGEKTAYIFYKIFQPGEFGYSFLFSNTVDSTYGDGSYSRANLVCGEWRIEELSAFVASGVSVPQAAELFQPITFEGSASKIVRAGELFCTDEIRLNIPENFYLGLKIKFGGRQIPCHPENLLPCFEEKNGMLVATKDVPLPSMVGCRRNVKKRIVFWGDSITQGIGTEENSYAHYAARMANFLGADYAFWNIGIGYGRGEDAASNGAWANKAKHADLCILCFGVNDIFAGRSAQQIFNDLNKTVEILRNNGVKVILQKIPPFEYGAEKEKVWGQSNELICKYFLSKSAYVFDECRFLANEQTGKPIYGGHPNQIGCEIWGEKLFEFVREENIL